MEKTIKMAYNPLFAEINIKPTPLNGLPRKRRISIRDIMSAYNGIAWQGLASICRFYTFKAIRWAEETACFGFIPPVLAPFPLFYFKTGGKTGGVMRRKKSCWERRDDWARDMWLVILVFALALSMLTGFIGWIRYRDERIRNNELMGLEYVPVPVDEGGEVR